MFCFSICSPRLVFYDLVVSFCPAVSSSTIAPLCVYLASVLCLFTLLWSWVRWTDSVSQALCLPTNSLHKQLTLSWILSAWVCVWSPSTKLMTDIQLSFRFLWHDPFLTTKSVLVSNTVRSLNFKPSFFAVFAFCRVVPRASLNPLAGCFGPPGIEVYFGNVKQQSSFYMLSCHPSIFSVGTDLLSSTHSAQMVIWNCSYDLSIQTYCGILTWFI